MDNQNKRSFLALVLRQLRNEAESKQVFVKHQNTRAYRLYAASYLMGVARGLFASPETKKQIERIIGISNDL